MTRARQHLWIAAFVVLGTLLPLAADDRTHELQTVFVTSSVDHTRQPSMFWAPTNESTPRPLLVFLHSWSGDYLQDNAAWLQQAQQRNWYYLHPNFRGRNDHPAACGSGLARRDVLDAVASIKREFNVDTTRVYLAGASGGGHMSMLMAGYHPDRFSGVSAWVGISNLQDWYNFHLADNGQPKQYAQMVAQSCQGPPGHSTEVDARYRARSPVFHLSDTQGLPLDLNAGVDDGHTGSVPIEHTLKAYNVIAASLKQPVVSAAEMQQLWTNRRLDKPQPGDVGFDDSYGRKYFLRRQAGAARVTIFEGGHEGLPQAACAWLEKQSKQTR